MSFLHRVFYPCLASSLLVACSSSSSAPSAPNGAAGSTSAAGGSGQAGGGAGGQAGSGVGGQAGSGVGGQAGGGVGGQAAGGAGGQAAGGAGGGVGGAGGSGGSTMGTSLMGTLGALGPVKPTVSSIVTVNTMGETLVYLSSVALTCDMVKVPKWLGNVTPGAQVIEIVVKGNPPVTGSPLSAEVNFAPGGMPSATSETKATMGSVTFTLASAQGPAEGTVTGTYKDGSTLTGMFHADWCTGGTDY